MIRRSKVTAAASSSCSSAVKNNDNDKKNITLEFASECHATDGNHNNSSSSDKRRMHHQGYARWLRSFFSPLSRQTTTKSTTKKKTSKKEPCNHHHHLLTKSTTTTLRCCLFLLAVLLIAYQLDAHVREYQGPLDHVSSSILKPYYEMSCPSFSRYLDDNIIESSTYNSRDNDNGAVRSWDCNAILGKQATNDNHDGIIRGATTQSSTTEYHPSFPRIFMIGARDETQDTFQSWQSQLRLNDNTAMSPQHHHVGEHNVSSSQPYLKRINTLQVSNQFTTSGGALRESPSSLLRLTTTNNTTTHQTTTSKQQQKQFLCRKIKWEQRLFHVYQHVFRELLATYPNDDGFVIIEDDATLLNPSALAVEVCHAHDQQIQFYSLYRSPLQQQPHQWWRVMFFPKQSSPPSCVYRHGTVAFYIQRELMQQIVNERRRSFFCRFPIDMYISKFGPWYATRNEVVGHLGRGRIGSS
mmetsp:Transcript_7692/g.15706  ORF Transcript_7692/g.15706 Transcript_7692/m.15706 type:complete len:468 (+) Transcript_7692:275-1678(+)